VKPEVRHEVPSDRDSIESAIGHSLAKLFIPTRGVALYGTVLVFSDKRTVVSNQLLRALEKHSVAGKVTLAAGGDFTTEARAIAKQMGCEILSLREFGWTDDRWLRRGEPLT
jgi:hypothetical protein